MTSADVIDIYSTLGGLGIQIWIDGGWGVDALLGRQTRPHKDLDIALEEQHLVRFERFLALRGYHRTKREIERPFNFVLADHSGREIDVHVISLDENGDGVYGPPENCLTYPAESLTGIGTISGWLYGSLHLPSMDGEIPQRLRIDREGLQRCLGNLREVWDRVAGRIFSFYESALTRRA